MNPDLAGIMFLILLVWFFISPFGILSAYRDGVTDGYGFAKEPNCPGYQDAGEYLKKHMSHRWPELKEK